MKWENHMKLYIIAPFWCENRNIDLKSSIIYARRIAFISYIFSSAARKHRMKFYMIRFSCKFHLDVRFDSRKTESEMLDEKWVGETIWFFLLPWKPFSLSVYSMVSNGLVMDTTNKSNVKSVNWFPSLFPHYIIFCIINAVNWFYTIGDRKTEDEKSLPLNISHSRVCPFEMRNKIYELWTLAYRSEARFGAPKER